MRISHICGDDLGLHRRHAILCTEQMTNYIKGTSLGTKFMINYLMKN